MESFIVAEKEELILNDWTAHRSAELFQLRGRLIARGDRAVAGRIRCRVKIVASVPVRTAVEAVGRAVQAVGSGTDTNVNDGSWIPAVFGLGIFHQVKFLDGVDRQDRCAVRD